jgi:hypothetical protein
MMTRKRWHAAERLVLDGAADFGDTADRRRLVQGGGGHASRGSQCIAVAIILATDEAPINA